MRLLYGISLTLCALALSACDSSDSDTLFGGDGPQYDDQFVRATIGGDAWQARGLANPGDLGLVFFGNEVDFVGTDIPDGEVTLVFGSSVPFDLVEAGARLVQVAAYIVRVDNVEEVSGELVGSGRSEAVVVTTLADSNGRQITDPDLELPMINYVACDFARSVSDDCEDGTGVFTAGGGDIEVAFSEVTGSALAGTFSATLRSEAGGPQSLSISGGTFNVDVVETPTAAPPVRWGQHFSSAMRSADSK
ncbi:MAG: hypothetical protein AAGN64_09845 [Bacteroidota bacterium]